MLNKAASL